MARLTFQPPRTFTYQTDYSSWSLNVRFRVVGSVTAVTTSKEGNDNTAHHAGVSIPNVRVHSLAIQWVDVGFFPGEPQTPRSLPFYAIVLHPGEESWIGDLLPFGYVIRPFEVKDSTVDHYCIRICETHLQNEYDQHRIHFGELHSTPDLLTRMDSVVAKLIRDLRVVQSLMIVGFDLRSDVDKQAQLTAAATDSVPTYSRTNTVDGMILFDSAYAHIMGSKLTKHPETQTVGWHVDIRSKAADLIKDHGIEVIAALDDNLAKAAVDRANKVFGLDRPTCGIEKPKSGRRVVLDVPPPQFPLATRCTIGAHDLLVFGMDGDRGTYRTVDGGDPHRTSAGGWARRDFMLIHRDRDCWRFLFWSYVQLHTRILTDPRAVMLMPYLVEDKECAEFPIHISPQRGMPAAVTRAVNETPFCAAAISHGLSRLRYVRNQVKALHQPMGFKADLHHPKFGLLFRAEPGSKGVIGTKKRNYDSDVNRPRCADKTVLRLLEALPPTRMEWQVQEQTPMSALIGAATHRPRAVMLDM